MLVLALLLARAAAPADPPPTPTPTPRPALGRATVPARPKTLSEHAAEMKAKRTPTAKVSFDDVPSAAPGSSEPPEPVGPPAASGPAGTGPTKEKAGETAAAEKAQRRMDRAVQRGLEVPERTRSPRRDSARREWDEAAEECRRTPGCVPHYRDDARYGENKPLKTDQELIDDIRKRGFSEPHPPPK